MRYHYFVDTYIFYVNWTFGKAKFVFQSQYQSQMLKIHFSLFKIHATEVIFLQCHFCRVFISSFYLSPSYIFSYVSLRYSLFLFLFLKIAASIPYLSLHAFFVLFILIFRFYLTICWIITTLCAFFQFFFTLFIIKFFVTHSYNKKIKLIKTKFFICYNDPLSSSNQKFSIYVKLYR